MIMTDPNIDSFKDAMIRSGIPFAEEIIPDGKIHRFPTGKKNKKNGWYILFDNAGFYGDWSKSSSHLWKVSLEGKTPREKAIINQDIKKSRKAAEEEAERRNQETAIEAENIWNNANETGVSEYLNIKKVSAFSIKYGSDQYGDFVAVPLMDVDDKLWNVQKTYSKKDDISNNKWFLPGGKKKGCFHIIGTPLKELAENERFWIVEGYATGASIHMATNDTVIVAFDAGNIDPVINAIKSTYPHLLGIIAGDDDQWPKDGNNAGRQKAEDAAKKYGCHVVFPKFQEDHHKSEPTDWNDLHCLEGLDEVTTRLINFTENLLSAEDAATDKNIKNSGIPKGFTVQNDGIYYEKLVNNPETNEKETRNFKLCSPLTVTALTRDDNGSNWGRILEIEDPDQIKKEFIMPMEMLAGSGDELREKLFLRGLRLTSGQEARRKLEDYISSSQPQERVLCVETVGWFQSQYILPHKTYRFEGKERIVYQSKGIPPKPIKIKGTIAEWETNIGQYIVGNPLLILSACAAMAPLFLYLLKEENCMFHLFGSSSIGKTTAAHVARSMWGIPMYSWRTTDNAAESIAQNANDGLVIFDEIAEVDAKAADNMSYMLGNGSGKSRSNRDGNAKPQKKFRLIALSTGEIRLESKLRDIGKSQKAGQSVRFIELEADAKEGNGIFKNLHEFQDGNSLSTHLRQAADQFCGTPIDSLIRFLTASRDGQDSSVKVIKDLREDWLVKYASAYTEGQVQRCAKKFALLAAVGEFAVYAGLLNGFSLQADNEPFLGEVSEAMFEIFKSWIKTRGGDESHELIEIKDQLVNYIMEHGSSRFENSWDGQDKVINRVGFRRKTDGYTQYYFEKNQFKKEILKGKSVSYIQRLIDDGYLTGSKYGDTIRLTENSLMRLLVVSPDILNKGVENES
jgi:putative DNA primase/helicase